MAPGQGDAWYGAGQSQEPMVSSDEEARGMEHRLRPRNLTIFSHPHRFALARRMRIAAIMDQCLQAFLHAEEADSHQTVRTRPRQICMPSSMRRKRPARADLSRNRGKGQPAPDSILHSRPARADRPLTRSRSWASHPRCRGTHGELPNMSVTRHTAARAQAADRSSHAIRRILHRNCAAGRTSRALAQRLYRKHGSHRAGRRPVRHRQDAEQSRHIGPDST